MQILSSEQLDLWLIFLQSGMTALAYFLSVWFVSDRKTENIISFIAYAALNAFAVGLLILILKSKFHIGFWSAFVIDLVYFGIMTKTSLLDSVLKK